MSQYEINSMLTVSTAHITERDAALLTQVSYSEACYALDGYGWLIYKDSPLEHDTGAFSDAFCALMQEARKEGCTYLHLDRDGPVYEHLPQFNW